MNAIIALCHFCNEHGPRTLFCTQAFKYVEEKTEFGSLNQQHNSAAATSTANDPYTLCKACRAFERKFLHYISYEINSQICYVSQSTPSDPEVFALVRKACLRTLHCEVFEDPIYFDDDKNGSVIGYEFRVKDSEGRGHQRQYSLLIIMKDRIHLQQLWSFLQHHIHVIASNIKNLAQQVFDADLKDNPLMQHSISASNSIKKSPNKSMRGLIELTNDKLIFAKLHMWFTWILRACVCHLKEELLCGPLVEDVQIRIEQFKFMNDIDSSQQINFDTNTLNELNVSLNRLNSNSYDKTDNLEIGSLRVRHYNDLISLLGCESFRSVAYHVVVGNQVIVRCKHRALVVTMLELLEELIPYGCRKTNYYSDVYIKSYECNLLGLSQNFDLSCINGLIFDDFILLDIQTPKHEPSIKSSFADVAKLLTVNVKTNTKYPVQPVAVPEVLRKMEMFLNNSFLDMNSVSVLLKWTKEEWLNKAKVYYKFSKTANPMNIDTQTLLKFLKLDEKDILSLKFWQAGLSNECRLLIRST